MLSHPSGTGTDLRQTQPPDGMGRVHRHPQSLHGVFSAPGNFTPTIITGVKISGGLSPLPDSPTTPAPRGKDYLADYKRRQPHDEKSQETV